MAKDIKIADNRLLNRRLFLQGTGISLAILTPRRALAQDRDRAGSVEDVKGEAFAKAGSEHRNLNAAAPVFIKDQVGTGQSSRLTMRLGRDTVLRMGESALVTIDRFLMEAGGEITLDAGPILFDRPAGSKPLPIQIRSPFCLIAVRGTRFFAGPSNGVFGVFAERGRVDVSAAGRRVTLRAGEGVNITRPGGIPLGPRPWTLIRIRAALASVE